MRSATVPAWVLAAFVAGVAADFQIYFEQSNVVSNPDPEGGTGSVTSIRVFDGEPSCDDVNSYALLPVFADASGSGSSRCEGCGDWGDVDNWDVTEVELHAANDWGHFTIYKDAGFQITPADGGPLRGTCTPDKGDDYDCTTGLDFSVGKRLFTCVSDMGGVHGK